MRAKRASDKRAPSDRAPRTPERTCIACRSVARRDALVRLVIGVDGQPTVDLRADRQGRGAWVHPHRACLQTLDEDPQRLLRALKAAGQPSRSAARRRRGEQGAGEQGMLREQLLSLLLAAISGGLARAHAAGVLIAQPDALERARERGEIAEIIVPSDAPAEARGITTVGEQKLDIYRLPIDSASLGAILGLAPRAAVGILRSDAFLDLRSQLRRLCFMG